MRKYLMLLLLTGCASSYEPKLASPPANQAKYEADVQACHAEVKKRAQAALDDYYSSGRWAFGAFGLAGGAAEMATSDPQKDYTKSGWTMMDECMKAKGYKLAD